MTGMFVAFGVYPEPPSVIVTVSTEVSATVNVVTLFAGLSS